MTFAKLQPHNSTNILNVSEMQQHNKNK